MNNDAMAQLLESTDAVPVMSTLMERSRPLHVQEAAAALLAILCTRDEGIQVRAVNANAVKRLRFLLTVRVSPAQSSERQTFPAEKSSFPGGSFPRSHTIRLAHLMMPGMLGEFRREGKVVWSNSDWLWPSGRKGKP